ncbi:MAG: hypothetical protein JWO78_1607 [Micavibrio sp.]|nr:hypothetical protein [Micavibrio sp.]
MSQDKTPSVRLIRQRFMEAMSLVPDPARLGSLYSKNDVRPIADEAFLMTMCEVFNAPFQGQEKTPLSIMSKKLMGPDSLGNAFRTVGAYMSVQAVTAPSTVTKKDANAIYEKFKSPMRFEQFFQMMMKANRLKVRALSRDLR